MLYTLRMELWGTPLKFCSRSEHLTLLTLVLAHSRQAGWGVDRTGGSGAALSAQNFALHPERFGEPLRMVQQRRNAIGSDLENLPAAAGWRRARRERDWKQVHL